MAGGLLHLDTFEVLAILLHPLADIAIYQSHSQRTSGLEIHSAIGPVSYFITLFALAYLALPAPFWG